MHLDEGIITKLVILKRCIDAKAVQDFYRVIEEENGFPTLLKQLESKDDNIDYPKVWGNIDMEFAATWCKLQPMLSDIDLSRNFYK